MYEVNKDNAIHLKVGKYIFVEEHIKLCNIDHIKKGYDRLCNEVTYVTIHVKSSRSYNVKLWDYTSFVDMTDLAFRANTRMDIHIIDGVCTLIHDNKK